MGLAMRLSTSELRYIAAAQRVIDNNPDKVRTWLTRTCPECGQTRHSEWDTLPRDDTHFDELHIVYKGYVITACEQYWVINPRPLGIDYDYWSDWTQNEEA